MKQLTLIRHAKSDWDNEALSDFDRPLNKRGQENVPLLTREVYNSGKLPIPEKLLCSSAQRTKDTINLLQKFLSTKITEITFQKELYLASSETMENILSSVDNSYSHIAICAHNPGITDFVNNLTKENIYNVPTFGISYIHLEIHDWSEIFSARGELVSFEYPKKYS